MLLFERKGVSGCWLGEWLLKVAFVILRVGPSVVGRREVKDCQRGLRSLIALVDNPRHKESVTGFHFSQG